MAPEGTPSDVTARDVAEHEWMLMRDRKRNPRLGPAQGGDWILNVPANPDSLWGEGALSAAARGEGTMIVGPVGTGKTTLMQRYVRARLGLDGGALLGMPVALARKPIVYLAMDRPSQIARSFRRMTEGEERDVLNQALHVWQGPLPDYLPGEPPERMSKWLRAQFGDVEEVVVDSYKDLGFDLVDSAQTTKLHLAMMECITHGIEWMGAHHHRKANGENRKPDKLDDVYGGRWLTAGVGSVICLWGDAGCDVGTLTHLKPLAEAVGPMLVEHDRPGGAISVLELPEGANVADAAAQRRARLLRDMSESQRDWSRKEMSEVLGMSESTCKRDIEALEESGTIVGEGETTARRWRVVQLDEGMKLSESA